MRNTGLVEAQARIKIARRNTNNLKYADDTTLMAESEELNPEKILKGLPPIRYMVHGGVSLYHPFNSRVPLEFSSLRLVHTEPPTILQLGFLTRALVLLIFRLLQVGSL